MIDPGAALTEAALGLVGRPFRLHGRDPAGGLDCVGVVHASLVAIGRRPIAPDGYGLRNLAVDHWLSCAAASGLNPAEAPVRPGDVLLVALGFAQHHLMIAVDAARVVHAHAGLRRVVCQTRDPAWRDCAAWRLAPSCES